MGVRLALGEREGQLIRRLVGAAMRRVGMGMLVGALVATPFAILLGRLLYDVSPFDPGAWAAAALVLWLVALLASAAPARRISRLDPLEALQRE
jgi:ABC-type antimicrobial peptide transport system permease subunit